MTTYAEDFEESMREKGYVVPEKDSDEWVRQYELWLILAGIECGECGREVESEDVQSDTDLSYCHSCNARFREEDHAEEAARESGRWYG